MSEYCNLIGQLRVLASENNYLRYDINNVIHIIKKLRRRGISFADALMRIPDIYDEFLSWIGYLDIDIPQAFVSKFNTQIPWVVVSSSIFAPINKAFVDKYADNLCWDAVCWALDSGSEDILRKHDHLVKWEGLSWSHNSLSIQFMYEYSDKLDWDGIFINKRFKYPYMDMKAARDEIKEELMSVMYNPSRISKWLDTGKDIEDYLQ